MTALLAVLTALVLAAAPVEGPAPGAVGLRYERPLGQTATYHVSLAAAGHQVSLGERLPVRWSAEVEYTEEVIARGRDGVVWLRVRSRPMAVEDATGRWQGPLAEPWPEMEVRLTSRGEVVDVSLAAGEGPSDVRRRALVSLIGQPNPVVLPSGRAAVGEGWEWAKSGAWQRNRLVGLEGEGERRVARVASESFAPLEMEERSEALGLAARLEGEVKGESQLDLLLAEGVPARHQGEMRVQTRSEVSLALPGAEKTFAMESDLRIAFDMRLVSIDGTPLDAR